MKLIDALREGFQHFWACYRGRDEMPPDIYCLALLNEEMGEALTHIGRALRFGPDTPEGRSPSDIIINTSRIQIASELGDVRAAIRFAILHNVVDEELVDMQYDLKMGKLLDRTRTDNLGRPLAPYPTILEGTENGNTTR